MRSIGRLAAGPRVSRMIGDVPSATAILDRFLHHAEAITITGRSYRLRNPPTGKPGEPGCKEDTE